MTQGLTHPQPPTPLEKLRADKLRLRQQCLEQAEKVNGTLAYMQEHAGSLLLSGLSTLLFPPSKPATAQETVQTEGKRSGTSSPFAMGLADYLSIGKSLLPVAWELAQPLLMSWGIRKAKKWVIALFSRKKS